MKKLTSSLLLLSTVIFSSCLKDYTCDCTLTDNGLLINNSSFSIKKSKKKDAEKDCSNHESSYTQGGHSVSQTCDLN